MRMKQRVLTGIVGALLLLAVFMTFDTIFFNIVVLAAYFIALYEIYLAFKEQNAKALFLLLGIIGAYFMLSPYVPQVNNRLVIALLMGIYALITVASFDRIDFKTLSSSLMFGLYVLVGFASITYLKNILPAAEYGRDGLFLFTMSVVVAWGSDIFAYFGGYLFGKHKLAPNLSPKKTIEGFVAGVLGALVSTLLALWGYCNLKPILEGTALSYSVEFIQYVYVGLFAAVGAVVSVIGDLFASAVKRQVGIKDYGNLLPGHGGILDRFDSVIILTPYMCAFAYYVAAKGGLFIVI